MRLFGAVCFVHIPEEKRPARSKMDPRAEKAIFLGYTESSKIYRVQLLATGHILDVPISECQFVPFHASMLVTVSQPQDKQQNLNTDKSISYATLIANALPIIDPIPTTYEEAIRSTDNSLWRNAIQTELDSMHQ